MHDAHYARQPLALRGSTFHRQWISSAKGKRLSRFYGCRTPTGLDRGQIREYAVGLNTMLSMLAQGAGIALAGR
jgi:hypothetical protein